MPTRRNPENLTHDDLATIVSAIQDRLYLDIVDDKEVYNCEKEWSTSDVCEIVAFVLGEYGLTPQSREDEKEDAKPRPSRVAIDIQGGAAHLIDAPGGIEIIVRDYDVDGVDDAVLETDENGERYQEIRLVSKSPQTDTMKLFAIAFGEDGTAGDSCFFAESGTAVEVQPDDTYESLRDRWFQKECKDEDESYETYEEYIEENLYPVVGFWIVDKVVLAAIDAVWPSDGCRNDSQTYACNSAAKRVARELAEYVVQDPGASDKPADD